MIHLLVIQNEIAHSYIFFFTVNVAFSISRGVASRLLNFVFSIFFSPPANYFTSEQHNILEYLSD